MSKILVVEDECPIRDLLLEVLDRAGFEATGARDGAEALSMLAADGGVDLVVTDFNMPCMTGLELVGRLPAGQRVMIMSGKMSHHLPTIMAAGFRGILLSKPFGLDAFIQHVERALAG